MGTDTFSIQLKGADASKVRKAMIAAAETHGVTFYLHAGKDWISIYPDGVFLEEVDAVEFARKLNAPHALVVMLHDSDIFSYTYLRGKDTIDAFHSCPDYFGEATQEDLDAVGNPAAFEPLIGPAGVAKLKELLAARMIDGESIGGETPDFEDDRLQAFGEILGIPSLLTSAQDLENEEIPETFGEVEFIEGA